MTPVKKQQELVQKILDHWNQDLENSYNPDRSSALSFIELSESFEQVVDRITALEGQRPAIVMTGANFKGDTVSCEKLRKELSLDNRPMLLIFGTGHGLHATILEKADYLLDPIYGDAKDGYNHLSVRSAVAIYCDRLSRGL